MPNQTTNYKLTKPLVNEFYDVEVQNGNMDIIDENIKKVADDVKSVRDDLDNFDIPEIEVDDIVTEAGTNPVSGAAVAAYALPKTAIVATTTDPGAGAAVDYPDGTVILVYE